MLIIFPRKSCRLWDIVENMVETGTPQMTIWRMRIACCILKATNTHSEYIILIAFPLHQWLHERASMLRYMYIACLVYIFLYIHLINFTDHNPFWQVCSSSPNKAIRRLLYNSKVHYLEHKSPPLVTVVSQINPFYPSPHNFFPWNKFWYCLTIYVQVFPMVFSRTVSH